MDFQELARAFQHMLASAASPHKENQQLNVR